MLDKIKNIFKKEEEPSEYTEVKSLLGEDPAGFVRVVVIRRHPDGSPVLNSARDIRVPIPGKLRAVANRLLLDRASANDVELFHQHIISQKEAQY